MRHLPFILTALLVLAAPAFGQSTFDEYVCKTDCSGHRAGYEWARKNGINNRRFCKGKSKSFVEGCRVRVAEAAEGRMEIRKPEAGR